MITGTLSCSRCGNGAPPIEQSARRHERAPVRRLTLTQFVTLDGY